MSLYDLLTGVGTGGVLSLDDARLEYRDLPILKTGKRRFSSVLYVEHESEAPMSSDSIPLPLSLSCFGTGTCEATRLYRELRHPLLRYLIGLGLTPDDAQDVVQDVFLRLHQHLVAGGSQMNLRSWVFRVAHNHARNQQDRYDRRFSAPLDPETDAGVNAVTPESAVLKKEKFQRLRCGIQQLTESERECLLLRAGGLRYREIGEVLGLPTSTIADTVDRAIKKLAEHCHV
jgi:RNA polymerase sigma-70 factor (ECF subfamily)